MRSERIARSLLRLYPRAWRARYGEEFLALVAESGLSWRSMADVVFAASAERVRAAVALIRYEDDPAAPLPLVESPRVRELIAQRGALMVLVGLAVWTGLGLGIPPPSWTSWFNILYWGIGRTDAPTPQASWFERLTVDVFWFAAATAFVTVAFLTASLLAQLGAPVPSDGAFYSILGIWAFCAGSRMLYCMYGTMAFGSTWPGVHRREIHQWTAAIFVVTVVLGLTDPAEAWRAFWPFAILFSITLRPPFAFTRAGAARRRAQYEATFGPGSAGLSAPPSSEIARSIPED